MSKAMRLMPERSGRVCVAQGEAVRDHISDEACGPLPEHPDTGSAKSMAGTGGLLTAALTRENLQAAFKRVKANKGAAGVDGLDIEQTAELLRTSWPDIRQALLAGRYSFAPGHRRGPCVARADDCNVYVGSKKAGERVMALLRKLYASLKLQINEAKSAVVSAFGRKFLGYALWVAKGREVKCKVAKKPMSTRVVNIR
jgi:hypothetical protein